MKQILTLGLAMMMSAAAFAQLGAPKTTSKDTLYIVGVIYNGTQLDYADWPARYLVEDAVNIYIADFTYKKGKPVYQDLYTYNISWKGHIDYYTYDAICNGKKQKVSMVKPREDCEDNEFYAKYIIEDYEFYLVTKRQLDGMR